MADFAVIETEGPPDIYGKISKDVSVAPMLWIFDDGGVRKVYWPPGKDPTPKIQNKKAPQSNWKVCLITSILKSNIGIYI